MRGPTANSSSCLSFLSFLFKRIVCTNYKKTKQASDGQAGFPPVYILISPVIRISCLNKNTGGLFTWKHSQALDYLTASGLHGNPVIAHQECKHDQGHELAGVGLQGTKSEEQSVRVHSHLFMFLIQGLINSCSMTCASMQKCYKTTTGHCNITCCHLFAKGAVVFLLCSTTMNTKEQPHPDLSLSFSRVLSLCFLSPQQLQLIICTRWDMAGEVGFSTRQAELKCMLLSSVELTLLILENFVSAQHPIREHALWSLWKCNRSQAQHIWDSMPVVITAHSLSVPSSASTFGGLPCPFGGFNQRSGEAKSFHGTLQTQKCLCLQPRK